MHCGTYVPRIAEINENEVLELFKKCFGADFSHILYYSPWRNIWRLDVGKGYYYSVCYKDREKIVLSLLMKSGN